MHLSPTRRGALSRLLLAALFAAGTSLPAIAATEVNGVQFSDTVQLAGKELKLNGAGLRTRLMFKVYVAGLYLPEKTKNPAEIFRQEGPRRVAITMLRSVPADTFANAFFEGMKDNVSTTERTRLQPQMRQFNDFFTAGEALKKGDVVLLDWIPGSGTICSLNGKKLGDPIPDAAFYNAVLRIWLGDHPVEPFLKEAMLGSPR